MKGSLVEELVSELGELGARALIGRYRGQAIYVPVPTAPLGKDHHLVACLGPALARRLQKSWGGNTIQIPLGRSIGRAARNAAIVEARRQGATVPALVAQFDLSPRRVYQILENS